MMDSRMKIFLICGSVVTGVALAAIYKVKRKDYKVFKGIVKIHDLFFPHSASDRPSFESRLLLKLLNLGKSAEGADSFPEHPAPLRIAMDKKLKTLLPFDFENHCIEGRTINNDIRLSTIHTPYTTRRQGLTILYFHGGGFIEGSLDGYEGPALGILKALQTFLKSESVITMVLVDYKLAPEHILPEAIDNCYEAYKWLLKEDGCSSENIVFMGDSAGGNLVLSTARKIIEKNELPLPRALIAFSPWIDLTHSTDSYIRNNHVDPVCSTEFIKYCSSLSAPTEELKAKCSPLFTTDEELEKFPPILIQVSDIEIFHDESFQFAERAAAVSKQEVKVEVVPKQIHVFSILNGWIPEATEAIKSVSEFIERN